MQFNLSYSEIERLIQSKAGKELPLAYGGPHTIRVSYKVPLMGAVGLDINVDRINGSDLFLSYSGGAGIEFMVRTALGQFKNQPGADMIELLGGNRLLLALGKNEQLRGLFERVEVQDIHFDEQRVMIDFAPKNVSIV